MIHIRTDHHHLLQFDLEEERRDSKKGRGDGFEEQKDEEE